MKNMPDRPIAFWNHGAFLGEIRQKGGCAMRKLDTTALRKEQAKRLRSKGMGYGTIAAMTGLKKDAVRFACRDVAPGVEDGALADRMKDGEACLYCGSDLQQHAGAGRSRKFCSEECRRAYWKIHRHEGKRRERSVFTHICAFCGRTFEVYGRSPRKYCSRHCFMLHRNGTRPHKEEAV